MLESNKGRDYGSQYNQQSLSEISAWALMAVSSLNRADAKPSEKADAAKFFALSKAIKDLT